MTYSCKEHKGENIFCSMHILQVSKQTNAYALDVPSLDNL